MRDLRLRYLDLLAGCLSRELFLELDEPGVDPADRHGLAAHVIHGPNTQPKCLFHRQCALQR